MAVLEAYPRSRACANAGRVDQCPDERVALVSNPGVSFLGAQRILPVERRVRIPRSVARLDGAPPRRAASSTRTSITLREPSVSGRGRTALVASPLGPR